MTYVIRGGLPAVVSDSPIKTLVSTHLFQPSTAAVRIEQALSRVGEAYRFAGSTAPPGEPSAAAAGWVLAGLYGALDASQEDALPDDEVLEAAALRLGKGAASCLEPVRRALAPRGRPAEERLQRKRLRELSAALRALPGEAPSRLNLLSLALATVFERDLRRRGQGAVFTPAWFAREMVHEAFADAETELENGSPPRFLDMSLGAGEFALAYLETCLAASAPDGRTLSECLHGWDLDPDCVWLTRVRLWLRWEAHHLGHGLPPAPWPEWSRLQHRDALAPAVACPAGPSGAFDLIVGNPPYIALSQANGVTSRTAFLESWQQRHPDFPVSPACDLSNYFLLRGAELLAPFGTLKFITSRNFFDTRYGAGIRRFLTEAVTLKRLVTLHSHPFTRRGLQVKASTAIVTLVNTPPQDASVAWGHRIEPDQPLSAVTVGSLPLAALRESENWTSTLFTSETVAQVEAHLPRRLGEFCTASMGVKSGANGCFLWHLQQEPFARLARELPAAWLAPAVRNTRELRTGTLPDPGNTPFRYLNLPRELDLCPAAGTATPGVASLVPFLLEAGGGDREACPNSAGSPCGCGMVAATWKPDALARRPSVRGHRPHWYHLGLGTPPELAVQCIVDTDIGVYWNPHGVWASDQFQVLRVSGGEESDPDRALLLYGYLQSHLARLLLEHRGFHRARFDGSFMLKLQVGHLARLPCPDLTALSPFLRAGIRERARVLAGVPAREPEADSLREELTRLWLSAAGYPGSDTPSLAVRIRRELAARIHFRWEKDRDRRRSPAAEPS